ncbi:NADP-dependent oxidoreductase domain [Dillenia turbinata]|uniref:NADP-dependent oxidoreductase domain n=1 Tax=Dillenia turbinata TaxID=194707 RepID=A0AAN8W724_9MAGN
MLYINIRCLHCDPLVSRWASFFNTLRSQAYLSITRKGIMGKAIRFFELNTGAKMPAIGLGTWQSEPGLVGNAVAAAIKLGYRHIDCAATYGNEKEIGTVLKKLFDEGVIKREDLWITSKLWCNMQDPEDVPVALDKTLNDLQLDYLDLYLIHWPVKFKKGSVGFKLENLDKTDIPSTWKAMEAVYDSGKTRAIGVSNFSTKKLEDLLGIARVPPAVNQVECHPAWQQSKLREFCKSKGVHLTGYSPLGSPGSTFIKSNVLTNPVVTMVAEKLGKTPAQVCLRWGLQMGHSVLPKSTTEARIKENLDVFDWSIPEYLFAKFSEIEQLDYRHIDCAAEYGNEKEIGTVLKKLFDEGVTKREDLWITSKLWCNMQEPEDVPVALDKTLNDLQLDYLDLYLIHWPAKFKKGSVGFKPENLDKTDIPSTWKAMEAVYDSGKTRAIGVSNFSTKKLEDLLGIARVPPAVNQVECHPAWQQSKLQEFCKSKGVHLSGYSPLGSPGSTFIKSNVLTNPVVTMAAEKLGKTPAQVCLRWGLQMGHSVLPKSTTEARIKENLDVFDWSIPEDLFAKFSEIEQARLLDGIEFVHETMGHYKTIEELWDGEL